MVNQFFSKLYVYFEIEVKEVLKLNPKYSMKYFKRGFQYKNQTDRERIIGALKMAGLPE